MPPKGGEPVEQFLQLVFRNEEGTLFTLQLVFPRENLTEAAVTLVMDQVIAKNIFQSTGGALVEKVRARLTSREIQDIATFV
jgi:uncharacterized protein YggL (DUF469 family)